MELSIERYISSLLIWGVAVVVLCIGITSSHRSSDGLYQVEASSSSMLFAFAASIASASPMVVSLAMDNLFGYGTSYFLCRLFGVLLVGTNIYAVATAPQLPSAAAHWTIFAIREVCYNCSLFSLLASLLQMVSIGVYMASLQSCFVTCSCVYFLLSSLAPQYNAIALIPLLGCFILISVSTSIRVSGLAKEVSQSHWGSVVVSLMLMLTRPLIYSLRYSLPHVTALYPLDYLYIYSDCLLMVFLSVCPAWTQRGDDARKLRAQRVFVRHVSHEMRSPLNTVYIGLQLMTDEFIVPYAQQMRQKQQTVNETGQPSERSEIVLPSSPNTTALPALQSIASLSSSNLETSSDRRLLASTPPLDQESSNITYPVASLHELTSNITASCETALDILNELLLLDKISDSSMPLDLRVAPMLQFIRKTYRYMDIESRHKQIRLIKPDVSLLNETHRRVMRHGSLLIDRNKVAKVYRNILSNALKFTPRGGTVSLSLTLLDVKREDAGVIDEDEPETKVILREAVERGYRLSHVIRYAVTDTGVGLDTEDESKLFKEFAQIAPSENQGGQGTGLGLYISRRIVQLHGGSISVTSPGKHCGSTFVVQLPVFLPEHKKDNSNSTSIRNDNDVPRSNSQMDDEESVREFQTTRRLIVSPVVTSPVDNSATAKKYLASEAPPDTSSKKLKLRRILIVDDSNVTVKLMTTLMRSRAEEIVGVTSGEKALQELEMTTVRETDTIESPTTPFDCVFLDHQMSGLNGPDTAKAMRALGYRGLIIGLTGITEEADILHFKKCGADAVLGKPLSVNALDVVLDDAREKALTDTSSRRSVDSVRVKVQSSATSSSWNESKAEQSQRSARLEAFQKESNVSRGGSRIYPEHSPTADASWNMSSVSAYPDSSNRSTLRVPFG